MAFATDAARTYKAMKKNTELPMIFIAVFICSISFNISASQWGSHTESRASTILSAGKQISRSEAVRIAKAVFDGKVLQVKKRPGQSGPVYVVKILNDAGRVRLIKVHAITGEPL